MYIPMLQLGMVECSMHNCIHNHMHLPVGILSRNNEKV